MKTTKSMNKVTQGGASTIRGAQQQQQQQQHSAMGMVVVKEEVVDPYLATGTTSRDLLRNKIRAKREAQGLGQIDVSFGAPQQHELTEEEKKKKERRREQNRRAAQRCRQKKKQKASLAIEGFAEMIKDNEKMAKEIDLLTKEKKQLQKVLDDHKRSGDCKMRSPESPAGVVPASPADVESLAATPEATLRELDMAEYLKDAGPLSPQDTFCDLEAILSIPNTDGPVFQYPAPPGSCLLDYHGCLDDLMPTGEDKDTHTRAILSPISPASINENRCSVSSTASDWAGQLDQSQGFAVPSAYSPQSGVGYNDGYATNASTTGSSSDAEPMGSSPAGGYLWSHEQYPFASCEDEEDDDEVFANTSVDGKIFQNYGRH